MPGIFLHESMFSNKEEYMKSCPFRSLVVVAIVILGAIFSRNFRHNSPVAHNKAASIKNFENSTKEAKVIHKIEKLVL